MGILAYPDHSFLVASVPVVRLGTYVRRLVAAGHRVGVVTQSETAALKRAGEGSAGRSAPFARRLTGVYTAATIDEALAERALCARLDEARRALEAFGGHLVVFGAHLDADVAPTGQKRGRAGRADT